jgi:arginyl-tRNA synthetase
MLKIDPAKGFVFDPAESLSFEGETGPYVQYTYARSGAILSKASPLLTRGVGGDQNTIK